MGLSHPRSCKPASGRLGGQPRCWHVCRGHWEALAVHSGQPKKSQSGHRRILDDQRQEQQQPGARALGDREGCPQQRGCFGAVACRSVRGQRAALGCEYLWHLLGSQSLSWWDVSPASTRAQPKLSWCPVTVSRALFAFAKTCVCTETLSRQPEGTCLFAGVLASASVPPAQPAVEGGRAAGAGRWT